MWLRALGTGMGRAREASRLLPLLSGFPSLCFLSCLWGDNIEKATDLRVTQPHIECHCCHDSEFKLHLVVCHNGKCTIYLHGFLGPRDMPSIVAVSTSHLVAGSASLWSWERDFSCVTGQACPMLTEGQCVLDWTRMIELLKVLKCW